MPGDSLVVRWFVHARRFLAAKHSRLGKLAVLGTPGAAKCVRFRKLAVRNAKGGKEAALYSKRVPGRESLIKGSPLAPRGRRREERAPTDEGRNALYPFPNAEERGIFW